MNINDFDESLIGILAVQVAQRIQTLFSMEQLWLPVEDYARYHGLSVKTVRRAIMDGRITVKKGGLAPGCDVPGARKRIHRFFDPSLEKIVWPK